MMRVEILSKRRLFDDFFQVDEAFLRYEQFDGELSAAVRRLSFDGATPWPVWWSTDKGSGCYW